MTRPADVQTYGIEQFVAEAHEVLERHGGPSQPAREEIARRMQRLVESVDLEAERERAGRKLLYSEPDGLQLMLSEFPEVTAVHTHGAWGVMVGYQGRERYTQWEREDDGARPGHAKLRVVDDRMVEPGDFATWPAPPNDIHRQWPEGGPSLELILMGNPPASVRLYFDLDRDTYTEGTPAERHYPGR
jgi:predicted metal-dependent enzyme (double-stranded beta helix superfamily)